MPSRESLSQAFEVVELPHGNQKITIHARVEVLGSQTPEGKAYGKLQDAENKLRREQRNLFAELQKKIEQAESIFQQPPLERVLEFQTAMDETLNKLDGAVTVARQQSDFAALESTLQEGQAALGEFSNGLFKQPDDFEKEAKAAKKELEKVEAKLQANALALNRNSAERLAALILWWDVTEGDEPDSPMYPVTPDNLLTFPDTFRFNALTEIEKKVRGR